MIRIAAALAVIMAGTPPAHANTPACVDDPPHICQPGNSEGKPAACYDDGGVIVALWPCTAWKPEGMT
jgi:hypothetical protein